MDNLIKAVVDRIEGSVVVLLIGDDEEPVNFPLKHLPGVKEGDYLTMTWDIDKKATQDAKARISELLRKLTSQND